MITAKAKLKMLEEMKDNKSGSVDTIHNFLCDQDDENLMKGILKDGKSLKGAMEYCSEKAKKEAINGVAQIDDEVVYEWVVEYFTSQKVSKKKGEMKAKTKVQANTKKPNRDHDKASWEQTTIFDFLNE